MGRQSSPSSFRRIPTTSPGGCLAVEFERLTHNAKYKARRLAGGWRRLGKRAENNGEAKPDLRRLWTPNRRAPLTLAVLPRKLRACAVRTGLSRITRRFAATPRKPGRSHE